MATINATPMPASQSPMPVGLLRGGLFSGSISAMDDGALIKLREGLTITLTCRAGEQKGLNRTLTALPQPRRGRCGLRRFPEVWRVEYFRLRLQPVLNLETGYRSAFQVDFVSSAPNFILGQLLRISFGRLGWGSMGYRSIRWHLINWRLAQLTRYV